MSFKNNIENDLGIFFNTDEFAEEIVYLSHGEQDDIVINGIVEYFDDLQLSTSGNYRRAILFIKKENVSSQHMDRVWINSVEWKVEKIEQEDNQVTKLHIRCKESISI